MSAIFDRIDAELWQEQQKQNSEPSPTLVPAIVQQFEMPKMEAKKAIPLTVRNLKINLKLFKFLIKTFDKKN